MAKKTANGWIFDCYPEAGGIRVWIVDRNGGHLHFLDPWRAGFYLSGPPAELKRARELLEGSPHHVSCRRLERLELFSNKAVPVLEARVPPRARDGLVARLKGGGLSLHSAD